MEVKRQDEILSRRVCPTDVRDGEIGVETGEEGAD